jgi:dihydropyrimidinase
LMMHAENGIAIDVLVAQSIARGDTAPYYHGRSRPWQLEEEATHRAIMLADVTGAPLYVVHVSAKQALEQIAQARGNGQNVFAETCPQYLYLSLEEQLGAPGFEGAKWVCSTPLRSRAEGHQDELWRYLRTGDVATVSTDHCPFCMKDQKEMGIGDFSKIPNGIGSVEHRIDLMFQGVKSGKITLEKWVDACCTTPARMFGMYPRKGVISPGADADIVIYDPNGHTSIGVEKTHHMNMDYSAYEGFEIDGHVDTVLSRGRVIVDSGSYSGTAGHGRFVRRDLSQNLI